MLSNTIERLKPLARRIWRSKFYASALGKLDIAAGKVVRPRAATDGFTVVMSPAGDGNIGDSAMLYSFIEQTQGPVKVMIKLPRDPDESALVQDLRRRFGDRLTFVSARPFYRSMPPVRFLATLRFAKELDGASRFFVHGADTIDGGNTSASLAAWSLCRLAQAAGVEVSVLGFSWRDEVPKVVASAMSRVSKSGALYPRDGLSADRLLSSGADQVVRAADMAFSLSSEDEPPAYVRTWLKERAEKNERFAILNVSGLIENKFSQSEEVREVTKALHSIGFKIVFLPHVIRDVDSDLTVCRAMSAQYGRTGDLLVDTQLTPLQVKHMTRVAELVVTGRMHLSILSLTNATPVIALATAGKVEGLFGLFGLTHLVVASEPGYGAEIASKIGDVARNRDGISGQIRSALPSVRELSMKNFVSLHSMRPAVETER
ncbi:polysaccharide pyruvyl transferase family protein [Zhihengliuella halotolerans]|uniref:polysaccharide pyruvyl transferase family protein n=1 Tax=Zhihengliuella halotolerans TaxID=370736 RepID=UPI000C80CC07|nr:polysaccharide pyruvyl transferase family protein [Zhihengliuella halotolerans]